MVGTPTHHEKRLLPPVAEQPDEPEAQDAAVAQERTLFPPVHLQLPDLDTRLRDCGAAVVYALHHGVMEVR